MMTIEEYKTMRHVAELSVDRAVRAALEPFITAVEPRDVSVSVTIHIAHDANHRVIAIEPDTRITTDL